MGVADCEILHELCSEKQASDSSKKRMNILLFSHFQRCMIFLITKRGKKKKKMFVVSEKVMSHLHHRSIYEKCPGGLFIL